METSGPRNAGSSVPRTNRTCTFQWEMLQRLRTKTSEDQPAFSWCESRRSKFLWLCATLSEEQFGSGRLPDIFRVVLSDREKWFLSPSWILCNTCVFQCLVQQLQGGHWVMFPSSCFLLGGFWCQWSPQRELAMC